MQKNERYTLTITDVSNEGSGIGKIEGMAVFVPATVPGDTVKVNILKVKKNMAYGKAEEILSPSSDRAENDCPSFPQCGGCVFRHITYEAECRIKYNKVYEAMKRIGGITQKPKPLLTADQTDHYRNKAQYPVSADQNVGFYAFHSHRIVPCKVCALQPEIFNKTVAVFCDWAKENRIPAYCEETGEGLLRHLYLRFAQQTGQLMVCLVINGDHLPCQEALIKSLKTLCGETLKSFVLNINPKRTNVILGEECRVLYGEAVITDILCGVKVRLSPLSFYQVNHDAAEILYRKAAEYADPSGKRILDLYCGAGTIGLSMAKTAGQIIGVEIVPEAVEDARFNAQQNGIENAEFLCADAAEAAKKLAKRNLHPDIVIVDPPRKGLSRDVIETIGNDFQPQKVVYVSCDPATLARDVALFAEKGYRPEEYTPVDLFPRTSHVETVCLLIK